MGIAPIKVHYYYYYYSDPISIYLTKLSTLNINMCHRTSKPDPLLWVNALMLSLVRFKRGLPFVKAQCTLHPLFVSLLYDCLVSNCGRNSSVTIHSLTCVTNKKKQSVALHDWQICMSVFSVTIILSVVKHTSTDPVHTYIMQTYTNLVKTESPLFNQNVMFVNETFQYT